jgi:uncharacterized protein (TIGR02246 family)
MKVHDTAAGGWRADADEVGALYRATMDGWNRGSGEAFAAPFAEDADFVAFDGARLRGRDEIARFDDPLFKTHLRGTRLFGDVTDVRRLAPDLALVHAYGGTAPRGAEGGAPDPDTLETLVAV